MQCCLQVADMAIEKLGSGRPSMSCLGVATKQVGTMRLLNGWCNNKDDDVSLHIERSVPHAEGH